MCFRPWECCSPARLRGSPDARGSREPPTNNSGNVLARQHPDDIKTYGCALASRPGRDAIGIGRDAARLREGGPRGALPSLARRPPRAGQQRRHYEAPHSQMNVDARRRRGLWGVSGHPTATARTILAIHIFAMNLKKEKDQTLSFGVKSSKPLGRQSLFCLSYERDCIVCRTPCCPLCPAAPAQDRPNRQHATLR